MVASAVAVASEREQQAVDHRADASGGHKARGRRRGACGCGSTCREVAAPKVEFIKTTTTAAECRVAGGDRSVRADKNEPGWCKAVGSGGAGQSCASRGRGIIPESALRSSGGGWDGRGARRHA